MGDSLDFATREQLSLRTRNCRESGEPARADVQCEVGELPRANDAPHGGEHASDAGKNYSRAHQRVNARENANRTRGPRVRGGDSSCDTERQRTVRFGRLAYFAAIQAVG